MFSPFEAHVFPMTLDLTSRASYENILKNKLSLYESIEAYDEKGDVDIDGTHLLTDRLLAPDGRYAKEVCNYLAEYHCNWIVTPPRPTGRGGVTLTEGL